MTNIVLSSKWQPAKNAPRDGTPCFVLLGYDVDTPKARYYANPALYSTDETPDFPWVVLDGPNGSESYPEGVVVGYQPMHVPSVS